MMKPPREFRRELDAWRAEYAKARAANDAERLIVIGRDFRRLYHRWRPRLREPRVVSAVDVMFTQITNILEGVFTQHLLAVVQAFGRRAAAAVDVREAVDFLEALSSASTEEEREELRRRRRETARPDFDPDQELAEWEERSYAEEQDAAELLGRLAAEWTDRVSPALRERLEALDEAGAAEWEKELEEKQASLR